MAVFGRDAMRFGSSAGVAGASFWRFTVMRTMVAPKWPRGKGGRKEVAPDIMRERLDNAEPQANCFMVGGTVALRLLLLRENDGAATKNPALVTGGWCINMPTGNPTSSLPSEVRQELTQTFGFVPSFASVLGPNEARLWWNNIRDFQLSDKTELSGKVKELIGLGVSAQIPCHYCVLFHTEAARLNGATEQEIQEAIFMASLTRQGSTILNGTALPQATFDRELAQIVKHLKSQAPAQTGPPAAGKRQVTVATR